MIILLLFQRNVRLEKVMWFLLRGHRMMDGGLVRLLDHIRLYKDLFRGDSPSVMPTDE
jgi:hypothetical protein